MGDTTLYTSQRQELFKLLPPKLTHSDAEIALRVIVDSSLYTSQKVAPLKTPFPKK